MDTPTSLLTLLHLLVLVYWLGGDLGAFYASSFLTSSARPVGERMLALKILNNVDMSPRTALILALPTGLGLAWVKGWVIVSGYVPLITALCCLGWLVLAWAVHLRHGVSGGLKRIDIAIRWTLLMALAAVGIAALSGLVTLPLFIALKLMILALCIAVGLIIRVMLSPLAAPIAEMNTSGPTPATDAAIAKVISGTRPVVVLLWICVLGAAYLGIATPV